MVGAGSIAVGYGLLTGNPALTGVGAGMMVVGGALNLYDWATTPIDTMDKAKEWMKPLENLTRESEKNCP